MKTKVILITFILATLMVIAGSVFKIMLRPVASLMLTIGIAGQIMAGIMVALKIFSERNKK